MPVEIVMPRLGWDMKVGSVAEWLKRDGDQVASGEPVCLISGDKATTELEAIDSGILRIPINSPEPGVEVAVGTVLAYLVGPGEALPASNGAAPSRIVATPRARRAASAHGVDWHTVQGSGRGGRILERDVLQAASTAPTAADPLTGIRRVTAERLSASAQQVVPVTLTTEIDATTLVDLRNQAVADSQTAPTYTDLLVKIVAIALTEHPALNASITPDGVTQHAQVHIGLAVDTSHGLVVPVIRDVQQRSVDDIARDAARLVDAARNGRSRPEDLHGATFTITNLGMYDIDAFTPVVNLPQCAVLGVGRIVARPVVVDEVSERVAVRRMLTLSLTFDHRLVDGAPAARFLQTVKHLVERPTRWLFR
ncbi:MAG TPA: dihydrolipoamide acetyltransferase family protein [Chloroflexota bacterium]|jgi:pyruvate dehydrogenase E2 component (dihydrolipoamide acetyltransferase)|nr:dihydrolipoamide acetyltransferase family protein [Chloroflexota bacterium]